MNADRRSWGRVLFALTAGTRGMALLEASLSLLDEPPVELRGLLVEDVAVLACSRSMLAREVVPTGRERPLDPIRLERQLRAQSALVRRAFERDAARLGLEHVFEIVRGDPLSELQRAARMADSIVVDAAARALHRPGAWPRHALRRLAETPLRRVALAGEGWLTGSGIVAVADAGQLAGLADGVVAEASRIAARTGSPLTVLPPSAAPAAIVRQARHARLVVLAARQAANAPLLTALIEQTRASLLIIRDDASPEAQDPGSGKDAGQTDPRKLS